MQLMLGPHPMVLAMPNMPPALRAGLEVLGRATGHFLIVTHRYEMFRALARDAAFVARINETTASDGLNTIRGALAATLVISLAALFDRNSDPTSLARVLNSALAPANADTFAAFHLAFAIPIDIGQAREGLRRLHSRLSREPLKGAIERLRDLRNQDVAHLDLNPDFPKGRALTRDIDMVHAISANIIVKVNRFCGVNVRTSGIHAEARAQAYALCRAIQPSNL